MILEKVSEIISKVREKEYELVNPSDSLEDLGIDSLGTLMVILGVATEYNIDGTEEMVIELVKKVETVEDIVEYVESHSG